MGAARQIGAGTNLASAINSRIAANPAPERFCKQDANARFRGGRRGPRIGKALSREICLKSEYYFVCQKTPAGESADVEVIVSRRASTCFATPELRISAVVGDKRGRGQKKGSERAGKWRVWTEVCLVGRLNGSCQTNWSRNKLGFRGKLTSHATNSRSAASLVPERFCKQDANARFRGGRARPANQKDLFHTL